MSRITLNHKKIQALMDVHNLRPIDLARKLGVQRQTVDYILHRGGRKYVKKLAKIFGWSPEDLLTVK